MTEEKDRRVYYQGIVYAVCNELDRTRRKTNRLVCGTADAPNANVQAAVKELVDEFAQRGRERDELRAALWQANQMLETLGVDPYVGGPV